MPFEILVYEVLYNTGCSQEISMWLAPIGPCSEPWCACGNRAPRSGWNADILTF